ncbi:MAG: aconitate hydratase AcnA [Myxococcales bacterium]|nr:aconitate hydratase AcnA [Myxococcales bacterium]
MSTSSLDSFKARSSLSVGNKTYEVFRLAAVEAAGFDIKHLPFAHRILLENLLRLEDGVSVTKAHIEALAKWDPKAVPSVEIAFTPARVILQDFTGVPAVVDLAAMRDAMVRMGGDPNKVNPLLPAELVIDHSVQIDESGHAQALTLNNQIEFSRNKERYAFLRWGQDAFDNFKVVPPDTGIVHQVNIEYLARVVFANESGQAYPDTLVGTDSHTTMVNGLGVLGWGVGGIEAEAAMLGQPSPMLIPQVVGVRLSGKLPAGSTATDLVLTVTESLRKLGVVGKFVEFFGPGLASLPLSDRATLANMAPEYGATCGIFPVDHETLRYLRLTGRSEEHLALVEQYCRAQGLWAEPGAPEAAYSQILEVDLGTIVPSVAGPKRPQDRIALPELGRSFAAAVASLTKPPKDEPPADADRIEPELKNGSVVIAAITSCTNTSNPNVLVAAGLLAKKAVEKGLSTKPWVKTSLAPGSQVVTAYLSDAGLLPFLETLRFNVAAYGCTTCIGNSGPLPASISKAIAARNLVVSSVLSGNRNFEGRVHPEVRANYLMSPPLVVALALAGRVDIDLTKEPLGTGSDGRPVFLADIWPSQEEVAAVVAKNITAEMFKETYGRVFEGDAAWRGLEVPTGATYAWEDDSTYVRNPPFFGDMTEEPGHVVDIARAHALAVLGDSVTTDHISPAGNIKKDSPAGQYLVARGVDPKDFNSYGARRGNDEVMVRGTFANVRIRNLLAPGTEGGVTRYLPTGEVMSIYDAAMKYKLDGRPLVILAGKEYGTGSSRDWAAKGTNLLGVRMVIAESFERIHRSNLIGMGVLPLEFLPGESVGSLGLSGEETFETIGLPSVLDDFSGKRELTVNFARPDGGTGHFKACLRIDTPQEAQYYRHGGILLYVLRRMLKGAA